MVFLRPVSKNVIGNFKNRYAFGCHSGSGGGKNNSKSSNIKVVVSLPSHNSPNINEVVKQVIVVWLKKDYQLNWLLRKSGRDILYQVFNKQNIKQIFKYPYYDMAYLK